MKGEYRSLILSHSQFVDSLSDHRIPFRDLRALLKPSDHAARFLDALASLKTMLDIQLLMFSGFQD